jgi:hypothetical protein
MSTAKNSRVVTLSRYSGGMHTFEKPKDELDKKYIGVQISVSETLTVFTEMLFELYLMGVPLGSKIKVTMEAKK